jgi:hypothetical protein
MNIEQALLKKSMRLRLPRPKRNAPTHILSNDERKEVTSLTSSTIIPTPQSAPYEDGGGCKGNSITDNSSDEQQHDDTGSTLHMTKILPEEPIDVPGDDYTMEGSTLRARSPTVQDLHKSKSRIWAVPTCRPQIDPDMFEDPVTDAFWKDAWVASAVHNVCIFTIYTSNSLH